MGLPSFFKEKKVFIIIIVALVVTGVAAFLFFGGSEPAEEEEVAVSTRVTIQAPEVPVQPQEITMEKEGEVAVPAPPVKEAKAPAVKEVKKEVKTAKKEAPKAEVKAMPAKEKKRVSTAKKPSYRPWVINVASFGTKAQADELKNALKKDGYNVYSTEFFKDGVKWQRIRVGFYKSEAEARGVSKKIASSYKLAKPWVVRPTKAEAARYMNK